MMFKNRYTAESQDDAEATKKPKDPDSTMTKRFDYAELDYLTIFFLSIESISRKLDHLSKVHLKQTITNIFLDAEAKNAVQNQDVQLRRTTQCDFAQLDDLTKFFKLMESTARKCGQLTQVEIKKGIFDLITNAEMKQRTKKNL